MYQIKLSFVNIYIRALVTVLNNAVFTDTFVVGYAKKKKKKKKKISRENFLWYLVLFHILKKMIQSEFMTFSSFIYDFLKKEKQEKKRKNRHVSRPEKNCLFLFFFFFSFFFLYTFLRQSNEYTLFRFAVFLFLFSFNC